MLKVLIVDDSPTESALLRSIFEVESDMHVVGSAINGEEALKMIPNLKPDIITMDILMPVMNGLEATRLIMSQYPTPIVIISSAFHDESVSAFEALEAGALAVLDKPLNSDEKSFEKERLRIVDTVRSMAEIHVIKRRFLTTNNTKKKSSQKTEIPDNRQVVYEIIAIGSSVGGPQALKKILSALPKDFPLPIVIVQHMTRGFINGFANWLNNNTDLVIKNAEDHEVLKAGTVYFAPDVYHLEVIRDQGRLMTKLVSAPPVSGFRPSATVLLQSVANVCGRNAIGIILTGMGSDGAQGLLELKKVKGHTLIQDPQSAVVFGMAGVAESIGAVDKVIELDCMADYLISITRPKSS